MKKAHSWILLGAENTCLFCIASFIVFDVSCKSEGHSLIRIPLRSRVSLCLIKSPDDTVEDTLHSRSQNLWDELYSSGSSFSAGLCSMTVKWQCSGLQHYEDWSPAMKAHCCATQQVGCAPMKFECKAVGRCRWPDQTVSFWICRQRKSWLCRSWSYFATMFVSISILGANSRWICGASKPSSDLWGDRRLGAHVERQAEIVLLCYRG